MSNRHDWKAPIAARLAGLKLNPARESEIIDELSSHLDDRVAELVAGGTPLQDAKRLALEGLSDERLLARHMRGLRQANVEPAPVPGVPKRRLLADIRQDLRYGLRALVAHPGFTAAAVLTLTLGIGANTAIFSLVNAALFERLPVADTSTLVYIHNGSSGSAVFAYPEIADVRDKNDVFTGVAAWAPIAASLNAEASTDQIVGHIVTGNFFELLGVTAAHGRTLAPADDVTPGAHPVAVISHGLWQRRFGGRSDIVGRDALLNGQRFVIVGVLPPAFRGPVIGQTRDVYVPMMMQPVMRPPRAGYAGEMNPDLLTVRTNRWIFAVGRLRPGVTKEQAESRLTSLMTSLDRTRQPEAREHPMTTSRVDDGMPGQRAQIVPVATLLLSTVGAVLLIACANVANLLLSRAAGRRREIAVRLALGASRWRLVRQFLTESVLLALAGGAGGVLLAWLIAQGFRAWPPPPGALPLALDFSLDTTVLLFTLGLSVLTGLLFGLAPAIRASRPTLIPALRDDGFVPDERSRRFNLRKTLVVVEVGLSLALLIATGLFVRSLVATQAVSPGFDAERLLNAPLNINLLRYTTDQGREFYTRVVERVEAIPGVDAAAVARIQVFGGGRVANFLVEGRAGPAEPGLSTDARLNAQNAQNNVNTNVVSVGYFKAMGIPLRRGREFDATDRPDSLRTVIVNEAFAARHVPGEEALGRRVSFRGPNGPWQEIVGVVGNSKYTTLTESFSPIVYQPLAQNHETGVTLHVRTSRDPEQIISAVRREIQSIEPNLPLPNVQTMSATISTSLYPARMGAWLLAVFGGLALLLASVGVYGVLAFSITRRTRELAIRMALGAERRDIFGLVLREGMALAVIGAVLGLVGAAIGATSLARFLYGIGPRDAMAFSAAPLVLLLVALAACLLPARRAMRVPPTTALKA
jgi:predicted permease